MQATGSCSTSMEESAYFVGFGEPGGSEGGSEGGEGAEGSILLAIAKMLRPEPVTNKALLEQIGKRSTVRCGRGVSGSREREKKVEVLEEWARTALYVTICQDFKLLVQAGRNRESTTLRNPQPCNAARTTKSFLPQES